MTDCHGDHLWRGTSTCVLCGERLRCACGCFIREDNITEHVFEKCLYFNPADAASGRLPDSSVGRVEVEQ